MTLTLCSIPNQEYWIKTIKETTIPGAIVETGVFKGGMMMLAAKALLEKQDIRDLWLYDTFEGMPNNGEHDVKLDGSPMLGKHSCSLLNVKSNMKSTNYPTKRIHYIKGLVENTLKTKRPGTIALLRLDTDFYSSTKASLQFLCPLLAEKGRLIVDDFNCWKGCNLAVNEYFKDFKTIKIDKSAVEILINHHSSL